MKEIAKNVLGKNHVDHAAIAATLADMRAHNKRFFLKEDMPERDELTSALEAETFGKDDGEKTERMARALFVIRMSEEVALEYDDHILERINHKLVEEDEDPLTNKEVAFDKAFIKGLFDKEVEPLNPAWKPDGDKEPDETTGTGHTEEPEPSDDDIVLRGDNIEFRFRYQPPPAPVPDHPIPPPNIPSTEEIANAAAKAVKDALPPQETPKTEKWHHFHLSRIAIVLLWLMVPVIMAIIVLFFVWAFTSLGQGVTQQMNTGEKQMAAVVQKTTEDNLTSELEKLVKKFNVPASVPPKLQPSCPADSQAGQFAKHFGNCGL